MNTMQVWMRMRAWSGGVAVAAVLGLIAAPALAQVPGELGADRFTVRVEGGVVVPAQDLLDNQAALDVGGGGGVAFTYWPHRNVGLQARGHVTSASFDEDLPFPPVDPGNFAAWYFDGNVVLRAPLGLGRAGYGWFPYVVGGVGVRIYDFDESVSAESSTEFAGNFGAGVEFRLRRWGLFVEGRDFVSDFSREDLTTFTGTAEEKTQHDIWISGGVSYSF